MRRQLPGTIIGGNTKAIPLQKLDDFLDWLVDDTDKSEPQDFYSAVAWVFWATNLRADCVAMVPYYVYPMALKEHDEDPQRAVEFPLDLSKVLWQMEMWSQLVGASYHLKRFAGRQLEGLQVLNANTMSIREYDSEGPVTFRQKVGSQWTDFPADEIVYHRVFDPADDLNPGVGSGEAARRSSSLVYNANEWAAAFFANGAIPATVVWSEEFIPDAEMTRIRSMVNKLLQGVQNAWKLLVLRKMLNIEVIGPPIKDLAMPELTNTQREQILVAHKIPPALGETKLNRAELDARLLELWQHTLIPELVVHLGPTLDEQLLNPLGLRVAFDWSQIEVIQRAELERAESAAFYANGVILPAYEANVVSVDEARRVLGQLLKWGRMPLLDETFTPEEREPPPQLQPGQPSDNGGSEREGPGSQTPMDERIDSRTKPKALHDDLDKWERKAITRIKEGYPVKALEFESEAISPEMHRMVVHGLEHALTLGDVVEVFAAARGEKAIQFVPEGQGDPLPPVPAEVTISDADIDRAIKSWDKHMPEFEGLLEAEVIHRENYDAGSVAMG